MAILNAGAMRPVGGNRYEMATDTEAFLILLWHGAHSGGKGVFPEVYASVDVAKDVVSGQFDLYFCSTACLRHFLNYCVDVLEAKILKEKQGGSRCVHGPSDGTTSGGRNAGGR